MSGDEASFSSLTHLHRRELHVHCYRMLASFHEAEDAVQETFLRAWRKRTDFDGDHPRAWLYRIATNVCLDLIRSRSRRLTKVSSFAEIPWLQPYPDRLLEEISSGPDHPEERAIDRETIELAFLVALQLLPLRQRAALIVRDVLGWSAEETAGLLGTSVPAANSALQRARATLRSSLPARTSEWTAAEPSAEEADLLARFIDAHERCDIEAAVAAAADDIRVTMPPNLSAFEGIDQVRPLLERAFGDDRDGEWRLVATRANRMPTAATYLLRPGDTRFRAFKIDVLRIHEGVIAEITTFGPELFEAFGLDLELSESGRE